ncbi:hypothetical protein BCY91_02875 [Pelobium manganitolerans]|uniref:Uncharacterized protein n=1 Tax=Pelobium manganitolerans TaxID=1842495 RepID=A0A419S7G8_9SPHI|nr:DUF4968 domain-containing protein [Pelobium manganitolerans]RKD17106.1 hypothetical protein BCY91_02875 [Pelobium manganitolerans]
MLRSLFALWFLLGLFQNAKAQSNYLIPIYNQKELLGNTLFLSSDSGNLAVTACHPNLIRIDYSIATSPIQKKQTETTLNLRVTQNLDAVFFETDSLWVIINKADLAVKFMQKPHQAIVLKSDPYLIKNPAKGFKFALGFANDDTTFQIGNQKIKFSKNRCKNFRKQPLLLTNKHFALVFSAPLSKSIRLQSNTDKQFSLSSCKEKLNSYYFYCGKPDGKERAILAEIAKF